MNKGFNASKWGIEHGPFTLFLLIVAVFMGIEAFFTIGQQEDPDFTFREMAIDVRWPGASAEEMTRQVTDKIEEKLEETPYLDKLKSYTKDGHSVIFVALNDSVDSAKVEGIWYQVRKKVADMRYTLPDGVIGPFFNDEFGDTYIGMYGMSGSGYTFAQLRSEARRVRDRLAGVEDVEKVDILGLQQEQVNVEVNDATLAQYGLTLPMIEEALKGTNDMFAQGSVDTAALSIPLRVDGAFRRVKDIEDVRFNIGGRVFRLGDIATLRRAYVDPYEYKVRVNGSDSVLVCVTMTKGAKVLDVGKRVDKALEVMRTEMPQGVTISEVSNQSHTVDEYVSEFKLKLGLSVLMVLIVSFFSLGLRTGVVVALAVPLVLAVTFAIMNELDIAFQRVSLGALIISLGLLVDDAMVSVEMMKRKLEEGWSKFDAATYSYETTAFPMLTGTLLTVAGFLPIGFAQSQTGEYVRSLFIVVGVAMCFSWFVAVYFTPYLGYHLLKEEPHNKGVEPFRSPLFNKLRKVIDFSMVHRGKTIIATAVLFVTGVVLLPFLPQQFFPFSDNPTVMVDIWLPEGSSVQKTETKARKVESFIAAQKGVVSYATYVGAGSPRFYMPLDQQLNNENLAQIVVRVEDVKTRDHLLGTIHDFIDNNVPGVRCKVERLNLGPPVGWPVNIRVSGPDPKVVRNFADRMRAVVEADPRTFAVHDDWHEEIPNISFDVDQGRLLGMGLNSQTVKLALQTEFSGAPMGYYREGDDLLPIIVRRPEAERKGIDRLMDANIPTATGLWVPLSQVADWKVDFEPGVIWRRDRMATIQLLANIPDTCQPKDVIRDLYKRMADIRTELPAGYKMEMGGTVEESSKSEASIYKFVPLAGFVMVFLLMIQMHTFRPVIAVLCCAPLGIIGSVFALFVAQKPFGFVAILGVIALAGMIMRNAVILVDQIHRNMDDGMDNWTSVLEATVSRFRPIVLTAAAAVLAFTPLTTNAFWGPMALAMTGGLIVATVLTITFVPALYAAWFGLKRPDAVSANGEGVRQ